jgi:hypothetical protein
VNAVASRKVKSFRLPASTVKGLEGLATVWGVSQADAIAILVKAAERTDEIGDVFETVANQVREMAWLLNE